VKVVRPNATVLTMKVIISNLTNSISCNLGLRESAVQIAYEVIDPVLSTTMTLPKTAYETVNGIVTSFVSVGWNSLDNAVLVGLHSRRVSVNSIPFSLPVQVQSNFIIMNDAFTWAGSSPQLQGQDIVFQKSFPSQ